MDLNRVWWIVGIVLLLAASVVCLVPSNEIPKAFEFGDKISHLVGHGALALYFSALVPRRSWWKLLIYLLLFGIVIEFAQHYMKLGRHGDFRDVLANSTGVVLGLVLGRLGLDRWPEVAGWLLGQRRAAP